MQRYLSLLTTGLCVGLLGAALCLAQQSSSTSLVGTVTDSTDAVVPGADIMAAF